MIKRRALAIALLCLWIRTNQPVEIARLKLVSFARQCSDITHPVVARTAVKEISKHQCRQRGVAASTAAPDDHPFVIDQPLCNEEFSAIDAVIDVNHTPVEVQAITKSASKAGAAAVVDVEHRDPATGPELRGQIEHARGRAGRTAMTFNQEWWQFVI